MKRNNRYTSLLDEFVSAAPCEHVNKQYISVNDGKLLGQLRDC
jgi:hypothetical protein